MMMMISGQVYMGYLCVARVNNKDEIPTERMLSPYIIKTHRDTNRCEGKGEGRERGRKGKEGGPGQG